MWTVSRLAIAVVVMAMSVPFAAGCDSASSQKPNDLEPILQTVIDAGQLDAYFHPELGADRVPLRILINDTVPAPLRLKKFGRDAVFVNDRESSQAYLVFEDVRVTQDTALVTLSYPVEGIVGDAALHRADGGWKLEKMTVREK